MAGGVDQLLQIWRELFERTRRTVARTSHRRLTIIRTELDEIVVDDPYELDERQPPAVGKWALSSGTWSEGADNFKWGDGTQWS